MKTILKIISVVFCVNMAIAQTPWVFPSNTPASGDFVGTTNAVPLELKTTSTTGGGQPINFWTNTTQKMTIQANGNVGIGTTFTPAFKLDVKGGDINVDDDTKGYRIGHYTGGVPSPYVLRYNSDVSDIYVGVDAGKIDGGAGNTFVGNSAGVNNTTGSYNTFVGMESGPVNSEGEDNAFVGHWAGRSNGGIGNTCMGAHTGHDSQDGNYNVFFRPDRFSRSLV